MAIMPMFRLTSMGNTFFYIHRHLNRIPWVTVCEHFEVDNRVPMSCESDETDFTLFLCKFGRFNPSTNSKDHLRVLVIYHFMKLPQIYDVGSQPSKAIFQMLHSRLLVAAVVLGHKKSLASIPPGKGFSHEFF
jgi:hypothetical protein